MLQADEYHQGISDHLSSVLLDIVTRKTALQRCQKLFHIKIQTESSSNIEVYQFGSKTKGLTTLDFQSDLETKLCDTRINIIQDSTEFNSELVNISMVFDDNDPPGYCRLQAPKPFLASKQRDTVYILRPNVKLTSRYLCKFRKNIFQSNIYGIDDNGRSYREDLTNMRQLKYYGTHQADVFYRDNGSDAVIENRWFQIRSKEDIHGPAIIDSQADTTLVSAFIYRGRVLNSPKDYSEYLLVPVGHSHSENENIQWRIDTSEVERQMLLSLNVTQIKCLMILNLIMVTHFHSYVEEATSSYIVQSLMFHMIELAHEEFWSDRNVMMCIKTLLNLLQVFVWTNNFPDYFSKRNLMEGKLNIEQRALLFNKVQVLARDMYQTLLGINSYSFGKKLLLKCSPIRFRLPFKTYYIADGEGRRYKTMQELEHIWNIGREKKAFVLEECQRICSSIQKISDKILLVWPAYDANDGTQLGFVVNTTEEVNIKVNYRIYQKVVGVFGRGERGLMENHSNPEITPLHHSQAEKLRVEINQHASTLFQKHRFISGISGSGSRSAGLGARNLKQVSEPCIVIYVLVKGKIPLNEGQIPKHLGGIPVDIREGDFQTCALEADEYHKCLRMGCQIKSNASGNKVGTLGGFVEHQDYGLCGITCAHVVLYDEYMHQCREKRIDSNDEQILVYQPDTNRPKKYKVGPLRVVAYKTGGESLPGIDLAMFQIESRPPETGMFPNHSDGSECNLLYESGKFAGEKQFHGNVVKFGISSGLTDGCVEFSGTVVRKIDFNLEYTACSTRFTYTMFNQLEIKPLNGKPFCEGGDSGALVFKTDVTGDLVCIGMVVGTLSNGNGIVTPISAIMNELGVSEMKTFTLNRLGKQLQRMEQKMNQKIDGLEKDVNEMKKILARIEQKLNNPT